jgi:hypothetical protein
MPPSSDASRSLAAHVEVLFALARVLAGTDEARSLVRSVYEHAAEVPPQQRPSDERAWLFRLLMEVREGDLSSAGDQDPPRPDSSFTGDPFRREVALQTAERMLPTAFAACSLHERFILAIDVLGDPSDEVLAAALDTGPADARSVRDEARSALRASLRDVLKGPERMLVDVALPEDALRDQLRDLLLDRSASAPDALHATVSDVLERARAQRRAAASETQPSSSPSLFGALERWLSLRGLLGGLAFLVVVTAGVGGATYFLSSSEPASVSSSSLVDFSVQRADGVEIALDTDASATAAQFIRRTWGRRVSIPSIDGASLAGAGRLSLEMGGSVPALRYRDDNSGAAITVLVFNYALMDTLDGRATLTRSRRTKLAANQGLIAPQQTDPAVVLWRQRDDIFVVVAPDAEAGPLSSRIQL